MLYVFFWVIPRRLFKIKDIEINLLCLYSLYCKLWNNFWAKFLLQWEDIHLTEENNQNYGGRTPQNFM
jgi:hypothetical protein